MSEVRLGDEAPVVRACVTSFRTHGVRHRVGRARDEPAGRAGTEGRPREDAKRSPSTAATTVDPTTKAVAVPIYQTVAYAFDSADHGAALFNLEVEGYRYTRIGNPTTAVLERRVAALEGGVDALCVSSGPGGGPLRGRSTSPTWAATSSPSRSSTAPRTRCSPTSCRTRESPSGSRNRIAPTPSRQLIDDADAGDLLRKRRQSGGQHLRHRGAGPRGPPPRRSADRRQHRGDPDPAAADRVRRRRRGAFADEVHGRARHHDRRRDRRQRPVSLEGARATLPDVQPARPLVSRPRLHRPLQGGGVHRALPQRVPADDRIGAGAAQRVPAAARHRDRGAAHRPPRGERPARGGIPSRSIRAWSGSTTPGSPDNPFHALARKYLGGRACSLLTFGVTGGFEARQAVLRRAHADQAARQPGRRQVTGLPSGVHHSSADVAGRAAHAPASRRR